MLKNDAPVGKRVAIVGAGGIGFDVGEFLLHDPHVPLPVPVKNWTQEWGVDLQAGRPGGLCEPVAETPVREVYLLQRKASRLGATLGKTSGWVHRATLLRKGVQMIGGVEYNRIDDRGLHITVEGKERLLEVDNVILCAGQESLTELMPKEQANEGPRFHLVGGAGGGTRCEARYTRRGGAGCALVTSRKGVRLGRSSRSP